MKAGTTITIYDRREMPASAEEIDGALEEGVKTIFLAAPSKVMRQNGLLRLECLRMKLGEPDTSGNVPWIVSHIIKKLNLENNGASFAFFALTGRVVTVSMSQLRGVWEKIIRSKGETVWNTRYRKS